MNRIEAKEVNSSQPEQRRRSRWKPVAMLATLAFLIAAGVVAYRSGYLDPSAAAEWLKSVRSLWWAPLAFIAMYTAFNVLLIPGTILSLTAGVVWGWLQGGLWVLLASTIASAVPYFIAYSGSSWVERLIGGKAGKLHEKLQNEGFVTLLLLRLVPIVPYNMLNYAAGLAGIRPRDYILATFIGTIPGIFIFTYLADSIAAGVLSPKDAFLRILLAGALLGALVLSGRLLAGRVRRRIE
ncbi:MAG: TVP38/TMEM64 family protein [Acidobacteria bacterium]|nr:TVP38/TMEM64 family protein [Acidobacteriota bacterium]